MYKKLIIGKQINSIYFGGGTPSIMEVFHFERIFNFFRNELRIDINIVPEVSLEVSPDTVILDKFKELKKLGINRINLGFQSFIDKELSLIGRKYKKKTLFESIKEIKTVGFRNVCIDLIYGLPSQDYNKWKYSIENVIALSPETICTYPLTLRPKTGFEKIGYKKISNKEQFKKYDCTEQKLQNAGYSQETHIRYIKNKDGGYKQKANHWAGQNVLGVGAGARSYLWYCDVRNGYHSNNRNKVYDKYKNNIEEKKPPIIDGYIMKEDERIRKICLLNIIKLERDWFKKLFTEDILYFFSEEIEFLELNGLINNKPNLIELTSKGIKFRDNIVQLFFSRKARELVKTHIY